MAMIRHKRGDTLQWDAIWWADEAKTTRLDLTGWTVAARGRHESGVEQDLTVTVADAVNGVVTFAIDAATSATMATGIWSVDIQRTDAGGVVRSTETITVQVLEDITP